jgi:hypothetical protein
VKKLFWIFGIISLCGIAYGARTKVKSQSVNSDGLLITAGTGSHKTPHIVDVTTDIPHTFPVASSSNFSGLTVLGSASRIGPHATFSFRVIGTLAASGNPSFFVEVPFNPQFQFNADVSGSCNADDQSTSGYCRGSPGTNNIECYLGNNWAPNVQRAIHVTGGYIIRD